MLSARRESRRTLKARLGGCQPRQNKYLYLHIVGFFVIHKAAGCCRVLMFERSDLFVSWARRTIWRRMRVAELCASFAATAVFSHGIVCTLLPSEAINFEIGERCSWE